MKIVDLRETDKSSPKYISVPQPMYIFHSKQELKDYIVKNELKTFHIISDISDFVNFTKRYNLHGKNKFAQLSNINVFLATHEKFVPNILTSKGTSQGVIQWKVDEEGRVITTDGCFIQLHLLFSARNHYLCFCSNGVETLSLSKWNLTAALKDQFQRPIDFTQGAGEGRTYDAKLKRFLERKKVNVRDIRLFHLLFNPLSDVFLNTDEAIKRIYGSVLRKADREKVLQTNRFRELFRKELSYLMGDLQKAFKTEITDKAMVDMAKEIFGKSIKDGTVDDSLKVYDAILNIREEDEQLPASTVAQPKLIGEEEKGFKVKQIEKTEEVQIELLDEIESTKQPPEIVKEETTDFTMIKPPYELDDNEKKLKEEQIKILKEDTDAIDHEGMASLSAIDDL